MGDRARIPEEPESYLPLTPAVLDIMVALGNEEMHGYAIMQEVRRRTEGRRRLAPGTLYRSLKQMGLVLCVGTVVVLPGVAARVAGTLGRPAVRQGVGQAGLPFAPSAGPSDADVTKEKELLEALFRRRKLTAMEAALETSLSVEEAERMLEALEVRGHLEVTVEHGRLVYALWEQD